MKFSFSVAALVGITAGVVAVIAPMHPIASNVVEQPILTALAPLPANAVTATTDVNVLAREAHAQINRYRATKGLAAIAWNDAIAAQARNHSQAMANKTTPFGHGGFQQRIQATKIAYANAAENVAYNQGYAKPADQAVQGWLKSPGHKSNIEGNYNMAGIGVAKNAKGEFYFTQVFIRSR
jgi:uncharacterized protein YkwD